LTGDDRYLDVWRKQIDAVNANQKQVDGKTVYPHMFGDQGWYDFTPQKYDSHVLDIAYLTLRPADLARVPGNAWFEYLAGKQPGYPEAALRRDLSRIRDRVSGMRSDTTTPDTRLADDPMAYNPASVQSLVELTLGGIMPAHNGSVLNCRLRYFDPAGRRAGLPPDVAALVDSLTPDSAAVTLVNVSQLTPRTVVLQAGGYAEHEFVSVQTGGAAQPVRAPHMTVLLAPGAGTRLVLSMRRHVNPPTMRFPW
jgi:hypothetical protein